MTQDQGHAPLPAGTTGQRLVANRYAILREIGRGGMGIVWLAEDRMIGRRVAIKELHLPDGVPPDERGVFEERVLREARTAGRLNDPAVVIVYDVLQESGNTYIVMELIEAPTLSDVVRQSGALPPEVVAALAGQLLSALQAAHAAGIVHRDVKPSNVLVLPNGRAKLTDFGIAQSLDDPRLTTSGVLIGSPNYMAPERIHGAEADAASDLWALGALLFYAVEGYSPFERASTAATMHAITTEVPYLTRCQGPLASVIMGLLIGAPQARLNAHQVRGLLAQVTQGPLTGPQTVVFGGQAGYPHAGPTVMATAPRSATARGPGRRWIAAVAAVIVVAGVFTGGWFTQRWLGAPDQSAADPARGSVLTYGSGGDIPEFEVSYRACGASPLRPGRSVASASDCDEPHDFQVFGSLTTINSSTEIDWPDRQRLGAIGQAWCGMVFASDFLTVRADERDALSYVTLVPTRPVWENTTNGSREIYCVVQRRDEGQLDTSFVPE